MFLSALTIFLSAFLLFLVQPLIAHIILPWFGGTAGVWTTCLMFFQTALLLGYLYAHWLRGRPRSKMQAIIHVALLGGSLLALPILPSAAWRPTGAELPVFRILALLVACVGAPYMLLSATSPLLQAWYADANRSTRPYRLYALSNAGSLIALLSYPVLVEPLMRSATQAYVWSGLYVLFVFLCGAVAWRTASAPSRSRLGYGPGLERGGSVALWVALAFFPAALLIAITSHLSQNIAPIPLLWVAPLSLYLISLILCFDSDRWYNRRWWLPAFLVFAGGAGYALMAENANTDVRALIPLFVLALFCCCMVCHGELARRKPAAESLTLFYLMISLGGALGGLFVGLLAPLMFQSYLDLQISLLGCFAVIAVLLFRDAEARAATWFLPVEIASAGIVLMLTYQLTIEHYQWLRAQRVVVRNFYGQLRVQDRPASELEPANRRLYNGTILHGSQYTSAEYRRRPSTYYCENSGVGRAIKDRSSGSPLHVGVVGLGVGTLAAYAQAGDMLRFYEINPLVEKLARSEFTYLQDCPARLDVVPGDARRSLEGESAQGFDLLAIDAFSGDAIPVHLLTAEAFRQYLRHLKPDGLLAVHISNKYLDLGSVVRMEGSALGKSSLLIVDDAREDQICSKSDWMLVSSNPHAFEAPKWRGLGQSAPTSPYLRLWTDDYSNLLAAWKRPTPR